MTSPYRACRCAKLVKNMLSAFSVGFWNPHRQVTSLLHLTSHAFLCSARRGMENSHEVKADSAPIKGNENCAFTSSYS